MGTDYDYDIVAARKRQRTINRLKKFAIFLFIALFCVYLYLQRDTWVPKLEGIGSRYESITQNDGALAEGNFPLSIYGNADYQIKAIDDTLFILNDSYLYLYSLHGDSIDTRQLAYTNAVMKESGSYALLYEHAGNSFRVDRKSRNVYSKLSSDVIITGTISPDGYVALVTESDNYSCAIHVFDENGKKVYTRNCVERINEIHFQADNGGCVFAEINSVNGEVGTSLKCIRFDKKDVSWETEMTPTMCIAASFTDSGSVCLIGDNVCTYYDSKGQVESTYTYNGELIDYAYIDGKAALILDDEEKRETKLVLFSGTASSPAEVEININSKCVQIYDDTVYLMGLENVTAYNFSGKAVATVTLDGAYDSFVRQGGYLFLLRYNEINRVNFKE
ncbi:MAG: hypothetical protein IJZ64_06245 [Ruminococcus sp.]|nr:hypothetical protein [Ruminococcus sp.]